MPSFSSSVRPRVGRAALIFWLLLAALLFAPHLPHSVAAPVGEGWKRAAGVHGVEHFVGQYRDERGQIAYCTDFERLSPENAGTYDAGQSGGFVRSDGSALTAEENGALSYLLHRWGGTTDSATAASVQLAVWALTSPGMGWNSAGMNAVLGAEGLPGDVVERARTLTRTAFTEAGPFDVTIDLQAGSGHNTVTADVAVTGASGKPVAGLVASAKLTGPFTLAEGSVSEWTSAGQPHRLTLQRTGLGSGSLKVEVLHTPAGGVKWLTPSRSDVQRLLVASVLQPRDAAAAIADLPAFQPAVVTRTSAVRTDPGTTVHDVLTVSAARVAAAGEPVPVPWLSMPESGTPVSVEVVSTLWGPLEEPPVRQKTVPEGTPSVGTVSTRVDGPGTYSTEGLAVPSPGWYVWTETIDPASALPAAASAYVLGWQGEFGVAEETTFAPWTARISTELSSPEAVVGDQVTDTVTADGFGPGTEESAGTVTLSMYGPLAERPSLLEAVPADAPLHSETTVRALNGTQSSESFAAFTAPGCYTVVARFDGDQHTNPVTSPFGEPSETVCVDAPPSVASAEPAEESAPAVSEDAPMAAPVAAPERPVLAQTGVPAEVAAGAALVLVGTGLALVRLAGVRRVRVTPGS